MLHIFHKKIYNSRLPTTILTQCRYSFSNNSNNQSHDNEKRENSLENIKKFKKINPKEITKEDLEWRTPWNQEEAKYYSTLRAFYTEDNNRNLLKFVQTPINLSPTAIKKWWAKKKEERDIIMQGYIPLRHQTLGSELATAHFIVFRGGAVKFHNEDKCIKADEYNNYELPGRYQEDKILEAIDCTDMNLYYEGLCNMQDLKCVEWLSFNGCQKIDDWSLDKISNIFSHSLIYLDLRNCPLITERGIGALYKMNHLKILYLDDFLLSTYYEMTCLLLQEVNPQLDIRSDKVTFEIK